MLSYSKSIMKKYFEDISFVDSDIESFNNFIEKELQSIIEENKVVEPTIIPHNIDSFKIQLDKIWVTKPEITEADGSKRKIYPIEARLRKINYSAPCFIEITEGIKLISIIITIKLQIFFFIYFLLKDNLPERCYG